MLLDLTQYSPGVFFQEARKTATLALPMMLAQIAVVGVGFVDTVMAGGAGKADLAAVALGNSAFSIVLITWLGVMTSLNPIIAHLFGAGKKREVGEIGRQGLWFGLMMGVIGMLLLLAVIKPLTAYLTLSENIETMLAQYLVFTAFAMPAAMFHRALHAYASSLNRPKPIMWVSWAALILNIPLNYLFVYGKFGMPQLGGAGCGLATMLVFWFNAGALWLYIRNNAYFRPFGLQGAFSRPSRETFKQLWKLGWPIGLSFFLEVSLFAMIVFLIAKFGENAVAAQQVVISLTSLIYMIPQAIGTAATVRIGHALGKRQRSRARYLSGVSIAMGLAAAFCTMMVLILFRRDLADIYTDDADVIAIAANILLFASIMQLFDFTQSIASYALRGYKLTKGPMIIHCITFWGIGLLPGYWFANSLNMGVYGFWLALIISLTAAACCLMWLLEQHSRHLAADKGGL